MKRDFIYLLVAILFVIGFSPTTYGLNIAMVPPLEEGDTVVVSDTVNTPPPTCKVYINPHFNSECILTIYEKELDSIVPVDDCYRACKGNTVRYEAVCSNAISYHWTIAGATSYRTMHHGKFIDITWSEEDHGHIQLTVVTEDSLSCSVENCVTLIESPQVGCRTIPSYTVNDKGEKVIEICYGETVEFIDESSGGNTPLVGYVWRSNIETVYATDYHFTPTDSTINYYYIEHRVQNECGCVDGEIFLVKVLPPSNLELTCYGTACGGSTQVYSVITPKCSNYFWYVEGGTIIKGQNSPEITVQWGHPESGYGVISIDGVFCETKCSKLIPRKIPIISNDVTISGPDTVCIGETVAFELPLWGSTEYIWHVTPRQGVKSHQIHQHQSIFTFNSAGVYQLKAHYECPFLNCGPYDAHPKTIVVQDRLKIESTDSVLCVNSMGEYSTTATGKVWWKVYNPQRALVRTVQDTLLHQTFTVSGLYTIEAYDSHHCNKATYSVSVKGNPPAPTEISGPHEACSNDGVMLSGRPTNPMYYLRWKNDCTNDSVEADSVTIQYTDSICNISVYQIDKEAGCKSDPYIHTISPFQLDTVDTSMRYGCAGKTVYLYVPDQTDRVTYKWKILPTHAATVSTNHLSPSVDLLINYTDLPEPYVIQAILEREYCDHIKQYDTIPIQIGDGIRPTIQCTYDTICQNADQILIASGGCMIDSAYEWHIDTSTLYGRQVIYNCKHIGDNQVVLIYRDPSACDTVQSTSQFYVVGGPEATIYLNGRNLEVICDEPNCSYQWSYNYVVDPTQTTKIYPNQGIGTYCCTVTRNDSYACSTTVCKDLNNSIHCTSIVLNQQKICDNIFLITAGNHDVSNIQWSCNKPSMVNLVSTGNPYSVEAIFSETGTYIVEGYATQNGQCYFGTVHITVKVVPDFSMESDCNGHIKVIDKTSVSPDVILRPAVTQSFYIDGDTIPFATMPSSSESVMVPDTLFVPDSTYVITMKVGNNAMCDISHEFVLHHNPNIDSIVIRNGHCEQTPIQFIAYASHTTEYHWDFDDGSYNYGDSIMHTYPYYQDLGDNNHYKVLLTVSNPFGCASMDSVDVTICRNDLGGYLGHDSASMFCPGFAKQITYRDGTIENSYLWLPDSVTTTDEMYHVYNTGLYKVEAADNCGCKNQSIDNVSFYTRPKAQILGKVGYCKGEKVQLIGNTGGENSYQWRITHNHLAITLLDSTLPNQTFVPEEVGLYQARLEVTNLQGCSDSVTLDFEVYAVPSAPSIDFMGNRCIDNPPVVVKSQSGQSLIWSNGAVGTQAGYYTDGYISAYYVDPTTGCASSRGQLLIPPAPNYDALLTGCYTFCGDALPLFLEDDYIYADYDFVDSWTWYFENNVVCTDQDSLEGLPISNFGTYYHTSQYNSRCDKTSPTLTIEKTEACQCDSIELNLMKITSQVNQCEFVYHTSLAISNHSATDTVVISQLRTNTGNRITIQSPLPMTILPNQTREIIFTIEMRDFAHATIAFSVYDSKNDCWAYLSHHFDWEEAIATNCNFTNMNIQLNDQLSSASRTNYFDITLGLPNNTSQVLGVWCTPLQWMLPVITPQTISGLLMVPYDELLHIVDSGGKVCIHAVVCINNSLCHITSCISAEELEMIAYDFNHQNHKYQPNQPDLRGEEERPILVPNPAKTEVQVSQIAREQIALVAVYNMNGQKLMEVEGKDTFSVSHLASGCYIVSVVTTTERVYYLKLIKQ